jgi:hypothetical protein
MISDGLENRPFTTFEEYYAETTQVDPINGMETIDPTLVPDLQKDLELTRRQQRSYSEVVREAHRPNRIWKMPNKRSNRRDDV